MKQVIPITIKDGERRISLDLAIETCHDLWGEPVFVAALLWGGKC